MASSEIAFFREHDYKWWLVGDTAALLGKSIRTFAVAFLAYYLTDSTALAGLLATAVRLVDWGFRILGGVLVDRYDRGFLMRIHAAGEGALWILLVGLELAGVLQFWMLFAICVLIAVHGGLLDAAAPAALRSIVARDRYPEAMTVSQGRDATIGIIAQPLSGVFYSIWVMFPFCASLLGDVVMFFAAGRIRRNLKPARAKKASVWSDIRGGFAIVWRHADLRAILYVLSVVNLGLNGILATVQFGLIEERVPEQQIGLVFGVMAAGLLAGSLLAKFLVQRVPAGWATVGALVWSTLALAPMLLSSQFWCVVLAMGLFPFAIPMAQAGLGGYLFVRIPDSFQGRAQNVVFLITAGFGSFTPLLAGVIVAGYGKLVSQLVFGSVLVLASVIALASRQIRTIPRPSEWAENTRSPTLRG